MDLKAHYDDYYGDSSTTRWRELGAQAKVSNILDLCAASGPSSRLNGLDIGCGEGAVMAELVRHGWSMHGVDISASGVSAARARGLDVATYDGTTLPFADQSFDIAVLSHVVEHLEHPRKALSEAGRVARWVFVEVPLEYTWRLSQDFEWTDLGHINFYSPKLARQLIQSVGLRVIGEATTNPPPVVFKHVHGPLRGTLQWGVREVALKVVPAAARNIFTYHGCFLAASQSSRQTSTSRSSQ